MKTLYWNLFQVRSLPHYPQNKLKKRSRSESSSDTAAEQDGAAAGAAPGLVPTRRGAAASASRRASLTSHLRASLGPKALSRLIRRLESSSSSSSSPVLRGPSVLEFKAFPYPLEHPPRKPRHPRPQQQQQHQQQRRSASPDTLVPEFRHLRNRAPGGVPLPQRRASVPQRRASMPVRKAAAATAVPTSMIASQMAMARARRSAKTPVFAIGDLERVHSTRESLLSDVGSSRGEEKHGYSSLAPPVPHRPQCRPALRRRRSLRSLVISSRVESDSRRDDTLGLQICLDLLAKEMSAATADMRELGSEVTKLELLLMIEAYGRLRDKLLWRTSTGSGMEELEGLKAVHAMFNVWIGALERIYDDADDFYGRENVI